MASPRVLEVPNFAFIRSMMTRSLGTFTALANSARTASRLGVASVVWATSKRYSVRFMSGFGRSSMILSSKVHAPAL